jgi:hypothetical protein
MLYTRCTVWHTSVPGVTCCCEACHHGVCSAATVGITEGATVSIFVVVGATVVDIAGDNVVLGTAVVTGVAVIGGARVVVGAAVVVGAGAAVVSAGTAVAVIVGGAAATVLVRVLRPAKVLRHEVRLLLVTVPGGHDLQPFCPALS